MTTVQLLSAQETPASILESETIPSLDRILLEHTHRLRTHHIDEIRRSVAHLEEILCEMGSAFDDE